MKLRPQDAGLRTQGASALTGLVLLAALILCGFTVGSGHADGAASTSPTGASPLLLLEGPDGELHSISMQPGVGYHVAVWQRCG